MSVPTVYVEAAFGSKPTDASYSWTLLGRSDQSASSKTRAFSYQRGRQNERNQMETGTANVLLADPASSLDPNNTAGAYYPNVKPMVPVRAYAVISAVTYPMFLHYAERWPRTMRVRSIYTERQLSTFDGFAWLALAGLAGATYPAEVTGTRVANVLNTVSWPAALRSIEIGSSDLAAATFAPEDSTTALTHLQDVMDTEDGLVYANAAGKIAFIQRHTLTLGGLSSSVATFSDTEAANRIPYVDLVPSYDLDNVFNDWSSTRTGGVTQTATDTTSKAAYGPRSQQLTSLATTDAEVAASVQYKLSLFKDPMNRVESVTLMPGANTTYWTTLLSLDVGSRITLKETPPGFGAEQSTDYIIQHVAADITTDLVSSRFTYQLWPADVNAWLILDHSTYGQLNNNKVAY